MVKGGEAYFLHQLKLNPWMTNDQNSTVTQAELQGRKYEHPNLKLWDKQNK